MSVHKVRELALMLHTNQTPQAYGVVTETVRNMGLTMSDMYQQLEMDHKYVEAFRDEGPCGISTPVHSHRFLELTCCRSSVGGECIIGSERHSLSQGDIMLVPPGVNHAVLMPNHPETQKKHYVAWISTEFLAELAGNHLFFERHPLKTGMLIHTAGISWELVELYFRELVEEGERRSPGWEAVMASAAVMLLVLLCRTISAESVSPVTADKQDLLNQVLLYVEANLAERITLEDTANHFWISTTTLSTLFSRRMGISFYQYVLQRRLREAQDMIGQGMPIENVAAKVGFSDYSAFYRAFRREYGMSPRQYRKSSSAEKNQPQT